MLAAQTRAELAADLAEAERSRVAIDPLTAGHPGIDVVDAYEIQLINIRQRVAEGARVIGHKVGLSSAAMQQMMGVDEPDYGPRNGPVPAFWWMISLTKEGTLAKFDWFRRSPLFLARTGATKFGISLQGDKIGDVVEVEAKADRSKGEE